MNVIEILTLSVRLWRQHVALYLLSGLILFLAFLISTGLAVGTLITDMVLALAFGPAGAWIHEPVVLAVMLASTFIGLVAASYLLCASIGAFLHTCAQIGAGRREMNLVGFADYVHASGARFWLITLLVFSLCALVCVPLILAGAIFSSLSPLAFPLCVAAGLSLALLVALPFWLSWAAQVVHHAGVFPSLLSSLKASAHSPMSSLILLLLLLLLFFVPMVLLVFYPIYLFFVFAPVAGTLTLVYYEAASGIIKN